MSKKAQSTFQVGDRVIYKGSRHTIIRICNTKKYGVLLILEDKNEDIVNKVPVAEVEPVPPRKGPSWFHPTKQRLLWGRKARDLLEHERN